MRDQVSPQPSRPVPTGHRRTAAAAVALTAGSVVLASCSLDERAAVTTPTETSPPPPAAFQHQAPTPAPSTDRIPPIGARWLQTEDIDGLGTVVVDGSGRSVYASSADEPNESTCYGRCADTWLPLLASGDPAGGIGIKTSAAESMARRDGSHQVTYRGHPLYWYAGDDQPGAINGNGVDLFGAHWFLLAPDGSRAGAA